MSRTETMIPTLPNGMTDINKLDFYDKLLGNYQDQATVHIKWWTHRQNPAVCWICDLITLTQKIMYITERFCTKSTVDMETDSSLEDDSISESETNDNVNDEVFLDRTGSPTYNEPEYDTVDDSVEDES